MQCYAERIVAVRFQHNPKLPMWHGLARLNDKGEPRWTGEARFLPEVLDEPLRVRKPARIFPFDMSDLFYEKFTNEQIAAVFGVMAACPQHTFLVLTKRAERLPEWFSWIARDGQPEARCLEIAADMIGDTPHGLRVYAALTARFAACTDAPLGWPLPNVHLGVSAENQEWFDKRWPLLKSVPAAVHWVSYEPALGPIDRGIEEPDWVVVGLESGKGARPGDVDWIRNTVQARKTANKATFVKQLGAYPVHNRTRSHGDHWPNEVQAWMADESARGFAWRVRLRDDKGADMAEWPEDIRVREYVR
jgi:protein gp37